MSEESLTPSQVQRREAEIALEAEREEQRQEKWKSYLTYIDEIVAKILIQAAFTSISYILNETNANSDIEPLFEIQLLLEIASIVFNPATNIEAPTGFYALYEEIMLDIMRMATLIPRIDPGIAAAREVYTVSIFYLIIYLIDKSFYTNKTLITKLFFLIMTDRFS